MVTVHYFYDPMCGWCYGATPLIESIANSDQFKLKLHPGGMLSAKTIEPPFRQHILESDRQIKQLTGAQFGDNYVKRVASSKELVMDSYLPTRAILIANSLKKSPFVMLKAIQKAHYLDGKSVNQMTTLNAIATQINLDPELWKIEIAAIDRIEERAIENSHKLMNQLGVRGYPTLILENKGRFLKLPHAEYYGRQQEWQAYLERLV